MKDPKHFRYDVRLEIFFDANDDYEFRADFICHTEEPKSVANAYEKQMLDVVERAVQEYRKQTFGEHRRLP